jgi:hypothetical protein
MQAMPHFLALYTMTGHALARHGALPWAEPLTIDAAGLPQ